MIPMENKNAIHLKQRLVPNCLPHNLEIVTMNGRESTSQYHTPLAVAKFTAKRKKIKSSYFIATPRTYHIPVISKLWKTEWEAQPVKLRVVKQSWSSDDYSNTEEVVLVHTQYVDSMSQYTAKLKLNPCIFQEPNSC
jgi:ERCC4-related helicase